MPFRDQDVDRGRRWKPLRLQLQAKAAVFVILTALAVMGVTAYSGWTGYARMIESSRETTANLANAVAQHAEDNFRLVDAVLIGMVERAEVDGLEQAALQRTRALLSQTVTANPLLRALSIIDESGALQTNTMSTVPSLSVADRDYFQAHRDDPYRGARIGLPVRGRAVGGWVIPVSRRFDKADGAFGGIALALVDIDYFQRFYAAFDIGRQGAILLAHRDARLMIRRPFDERNFGRDLSSGGIFQALQSMPAGSAEIRSSTDGVRRLNSYKVVPSYPLVAAVALQTDEVLADWWSDLIRDFVVASIVALIIAVLGLRLAAQVGLRQDAQKEAERASNAKSAFLAIVSHELRTPLNGILGFATLLLDGNLEPQQRKRAQLLRDAGQSLLSLINDILDLTKIDAGKLELEDIPFNPRDLAAVVLAVVGVDARNKKLDLDLDVDADLPPWISGDPTRVRQLLLNLLSNAIKFTEAGRVTLSIRRDRSAGDRIRIEVADTGPGIPDDRQHLLFQSFSQLDPSTTRRFGGTGLGLAICKRLVELMGGTIGVDSVVGRGSRFWFTFPLRAAKAPAEAAAAGAVAASPARVLVAEDNLLSQMVVQGLLEAAGHSVVLVSNGAEAIEAVKGSDFDLILMDMEMPVMDGISAAQAIRQLDDRVRGIPIIALTANAMAGEIARCRHAGMNEHLAKPVDRGRLLQTIARWTGCPPAVPAARVPPRLPVVMDEATLAELERHMGQDRVREIVGIFRRQVGASVEAIARGDREQVARESHMLVSMAGNLGLLELAQHCRELLEQARGGDLDLSGMTSALPALAQRAIAAIDARFPEPSPTARGQAPIVA